MADAAFNRATELHYRRADHHWQHWNAPGYYAFLMSDRAIVEMICDWQGANRAQGHGGTLADVARWFSIAHLRMMLHRETKDRVVELLRPAWCPADVWWAALATFRPLEVCEAQGRGKATVRLYGLAWDSPVSAALLAAGWHQTAGNDPAAACGDVSEQGHAWYATTSGAL